MPSSFHVLLGLGGTALVVGVMALWLHEPPQPSSFSDTFTSSPKMVGSSALSHGGPSSNNRIAADLSPTHFQIGQKLIVTAADNAPHAVTLLPLPPGSTTSASPVRETRSLSPGTVVLISGMQATEPTPGHTEQYYEVTISDGRKGWLSEHVLRPATN